MSEQIDSYQSWKQAEKKIDDAYKSGKLSGDQAKKILDSARDNYRNNNYNKQMDKMK